MKTLTIILAAAVALALAAGATHATDKQAPVLKNDLTRTPASSIVLPKSNRKSPKGSADPTKGATDTSKIGKPPKRSDVDAATNIGGGKIAMRLEIQQVSARRDAQGIIVTGVLQNAWGIEIPASYTLMQWDGKSSWLNQRKGANILVPAKGTKTVTMQLPATNDQLQLRWVVSWSKSGGGNVAKQFSIAAEAPPVKKTSYVVRYMTKNGGRVCCTDGQGDLALDSARFRARTAKSFGFQTEIQRTTSTFGSSQRYRLYVWLEKEEKRTFDTLDEAKKFRGQISVLDVESRGTLFVIKISEE